MNCRTALETWKRKLPDLYIQSLTRFCLNQSGLDCNGIWNNQFNSVSLECMASNQDVNLTDYAEYHECTISGTIFEIKEYMILKGKQEGV